MTEEQLGEIAAAAYMSARSKKEAVSLMKDTSIRESSSKSWEPLNVEDWVLGALWEALSEYDSRRWP